MTDLRVAPCSHTAAKLAVERWHYSRTMPVGKLARFGIWERDEFVGVVLFGSMPPKHRYVMPLDRAMRRQVTKLAQPYPQSADQVSMGDVQPTGRKGQVRSLRSAPLAEASA